MKTKVYCPVCRTFFIHKYNNNVETGMETLCTVCGARLKIAEVEPAIIAHRIGGDPETEIRERVENFARLRNYTFTPDKEDIIAGILDKYHQYGDFYCPCRFDNISENICPCLETRTNQVKKEGQCF